MNKSLSLAGVLLLGASVAPLCAQAQTSCPPGMIYRVKLNVCAPKEQNLQWLKTDNKPAAAKPAAKVVTAKPAAKVAAKPAPKPVAKVAEKIARPTEAAIAPKPLADEKLKVDVARFLDEKNRMKSEAEAPKSVVENVQPAAPEPVRLAEPVPEPVVEPAPVAQAEAVVEPADPHPVTPVETAAISAPEPVVEEPKPEPKPVVAEAPRKEPPRVVPIYSSSEASPPRRNVVEEMRAEDARVYAALREAAKGKATKGEYDIGDHVPDDVAMIPAPATIPQANGFPFFIAGTDAVLVLPSSRTVFQVYKADQRASK